MDKKEKIVTIRIDGAVLEAAMDVRAWKEKQTGTPQSISAVMREAIMRMRRQELGIDGGNNQC